MFWWRVQKALEALGWRVQRVWDGEWVNVFVQRLWKKVLSLCFGMRCEKYSTILLEDLGWRVRKVKIIMEVQCFGERFKRLWNEEMFRTVVKGLGMKGSRSLGCKMQNRSKVLDKGSKSLGWGAQKDLFCFWMRSKGLKISLNLS